MRDYIMHSTIPVIRLEASKSFFRDFTSKFPDINFSLHVMSSTVCAFMCVTRITINDLFKELKVGLCVLRFFGYLSLGYSPAHDPTSSPPHAYHQYGSWR